MTAGGVAPLFTVCNPPFHSSAEAAAAATAKKWSNLSRDR